MQTELRLSFVGLLAFTLTGLAVLKLDAQNLGPESAGSCRVVGGELDE